MTDQPHRPDDEFGDEPFDLGEILRSLTGGEANPELMAQLQQMGLGSMDPAMMQQLQAQIQAMMSAPSDGSLNMSVATDVARKTVSAAGDPSISESTKRDVEQVTAVADLWLDAVTDFASTGAGKAWSRSEWVEATMPTWRRLVDPIATAVGGAVQRAMREQIERLGAAEAGGMPGAMMGQMEPMIARMSSGVFAAQLGQAVGTLAGDLVSGAEVGLPLVEGDPVVMLPSNVAAFAEGLEVDAGEVHLFLAVREAARVRLFHAVPWLGPALLAAVQSYAGDIRIDTEGIEEALQGIDGQDPQQMQQALQGSMFNPEPSEAQKRALAHLETLLALVEGWVDQVSAAAVAPHLPHAAALAEAVRRRRATGGAAERVFASLVGLELRPRRMREAAALFAALEEAGGGARRDEAWKHPDFAPTAADLDDPAAYVAGERTIEAGSGTDDMDDALAALLAQGTDELNAERSSEDDESSGKDKGEDDEPGPTPS
ncbi:zinc-dependent metalloprotease [Calidifontibacter sp. DB0510]|uniref:Zinc-dependent metalloprotease n=1 Tax=Metallococcus carri TaxID=1656884 RepID=A0A967E9K2_9MICO|nr:zinc-dependent metalloprotease [Metallococcus carri]NHN56477.1 zinc-dependent metalloprotease [Metallococcus carri]NOP36101.1 zinc-dependent metalloprotease [Calidifontibacter sp. DB2511S]